jgi:hypothetical protein
MLLCLKPLIACLWGQIQTGIWDSRWSESTSWPSKLMCTNSLVVEFPKILQFFTPLSLASLLLKMPLTISKLESHSFLKNQHHFPPGRAPRLTGHPSSLLPPWNILRADVFFVRVVTQTVSFTILASLLH